jgi:hypothetical protein
MGAVNSLTVIQNYSRKSSLIKRNKYKLVAGRWVASLGMTQAEANRVMIKS